MYPDFITTPTIYLNQFSWQVNHNHIIIFCGASQRMAPLEVISIIKSIAVKKIFERFPNLKKEDL